jgi:MoaA/NifB/PqqE/SkfB family radical SAM enzyme
MRSADTLLRDAGFLLSRRLNRSLVPPDRVSVNLTLRCNLHCTMCTTCYDAPELSTAEVKGIIDQTANWGVQVFNPLGGEPFMRADLEELLSYAVRRGFYVTLTTNGTLITEKRAAWLAEIPADRLHLNISLDGDEAGHDPIRGKGNWRRAIDGYQRVRAADAKAGNSRRKMLANTILHRHVLPRFEAVLAEQEALGFDGVQILNLFRAGDDPPAEAAALWMRDEELPALAALVERLARRAETQPDTGYRIGNQPADLRRVPSYYTDALKPLDAPCWAGWKELYINADGKAIMCDGNLDFLKGEFGDVRTQTLQQLWQSPKLQARREVVKRCTTPCVQDCYLRGSSDSAGELAVDGARLVADRVGRRLSRLLPKVEHVPDATLTLELSDVCDCGWEGCSTPRRRFETLTADLPAPPDAQSWLRHRDSGQLRFDRGFMGFEVVRAVAADLLSSRLRFGTLALRWRGEPLLHPEVLPILRHLLLLVDEDKLVDRLRIETSGRFLVPDVAALAAGSAPIDWVFDLDRGEGAGVDLLRAARGPQSRIVLARAATAEVSAPADLSRFPWAKPAAGRFPDDGDRLWFRRTDHSDFLANARARQHLAAVGLQLGLRPALGEEDQPRRCQAVARSPTVSWDGKVVLCTADTQLHNRVGDVVSGRLSEAWRGATRAQDRAAVGTRGVPARPICQDCALPWSPNHP